MRLVAPNNEGVFTFRLEDSEREIIFVRSQVVVGDIENNHCSNHYANASGCSDCEVITLLHAIADNDFEKVGIPIKLGNLRKAGIGIPFVITPRDPSPRTQLIQQQMARMLAIFFTEAKNASAKAAKKATKRLLKTSEDEKTIILAAYAAIEWNNLVDSMVADLAAAYQAGTMDAFQQLGVTDEASQTEANKAALAYARERASEMIGKKFEEDKLVDNLHAKFVIADTTKDDIQDIVEALYSAELTPDEIEQAIKRAATFGNLRAQFIAENETAVALVKGHLDTWKLLGKVSMVNIVLSTSHTITDECDKHAAGSPYKISEVPAIPAHPHCMCSIQAAEVLE